MIEVRFDTIELDSQHCEPGNRKIPGAIFPIRMLFGTWPWSGVAEMLELFTGCVLFPLLPRRCPAPEPPLPRHFPDQPARLQHIEVALHGGAGGAGLKLGLRGGEQVLSQTSTLSARGTRSLSVRLPVPRTG